MAVKKALTLYGGDIKELQSGDTLPIMVGDTGSGGVAGQAPAPAAGDAAAGKFLKADGTYAVPADGPSIGLTIALSTGKFSL